MRSEAVDVVAANRYSQIVGTERYVIKEIDEAIAAGDLEPTTGTGKPIPNLNRDPDWWVRAFLKREDYAERLAEITSYRKGEVAAAVAAEHLSDARETIADLNEVLERWNEKAPEEFILEAVSEIWLITERAKAPGH